MKKLKQKNLKREKDKSPLLSLIMGVYNEEQNLKNVYDEARKIFLKAKISYEIVFMEGGSVDNSWKLLQDLAKKNDDCRVIKTEKAPGSKIEAGLRVARGKYIALMCSDGQDNPNVLPKFIKLLEENKADFVKAKRVNRVFWERKVISMIYNVSCRILFGLNLKDINMHPKVFRRELVKGINLISKGESVDLEIMLRARRKGYKVIEIPIKERVRGGGSSSVNPSVALNMIKDMFSYKWGEKNRLLR